MLLNYKYNIEGTYFFNIFCAIFSAALGLINELNSINSAPFNFGLLSTLGAPLNISAVKI